MGFQASHRYARVSSRKVRLVADLVRGSNVNSALEVLAAMPQRGAALFRLVIRSAVANAAQVSGTNVNLLFIGKIYVNDGPVMKRGRAAARGRWHPIHKKTSHLHVVLEERLNKSEQEARMAGGDG